jgi:hypothetical protein
MEFLNHIERIAYDNNILDSKIVNNENILNQLINKIINEQYHKYAEEFYNYVEELFRKENLLLQKSQYNK